METLDIIGQSIETFSSCWRYTWHLKSIQDDREFTNNLYTMKFQIENNEPNVEFQRHIKNIVFVLWDVMDFIQKKGHSIYQSCGVILDHSSLRVPIVIPVQKYTTYDENVLVSQIINEYFDDNTKIIFNGIVTVKILVCKFF